MILEESVRLYLRHAPNSYDIQLDRLVERIATSSRCPKRGYVTSAMSVS